MSKTTPGLRRQAALLQVRARLRPPPKPGSHCVPSASATLFVDIEVPWNPQATVPILFLVAGSIGYSLVIGGLTLGSSDGSVSSASYVKQYSPESRDSGYALDGVVTELPPETSEAESVGSDEIDFKVNRSFKVRQP